MYFVTDLDIDLEAERCSLEKVKRLWMTSARYLRPARASCNRHGTNFIVSGLMRWAVCAEMVIDLGRDSLVKVS